MAVIIDQVELDVVAPPAAPATPGGADTPAPPSPQAARREWLAALAEWQRQQLRLLAD
jgi:hypothetical protein